MPERSGKNRPSGIISGVLSSLGIPGGRTPGVVRPTLIVTSGREDLQEPFRARLAAWIRARFDEGVECVHLDSKAAVRLDGRNTVIYYGLDPAPPAPRFVSGLVSWLGGSADRTLVWAGYGGGAFDFSEWGFSVDGRVLPEGEGGGILHYAGKGGREVGLFFSNGIRLPAVIRDGSRARVEAHVKDGGGTRVPLMVDGRADKGGRVLYTGFHPTGGLESRRRREAYLAFMDLLHGVFPGRGGDRKQMFVRLEDINAATRFRSDNPHLPTIRNSAEVLARHGVPMVLSVIPKYDNPMQPDGSGALKAPLERDFLGEVKSLLKEHPGSTVVLHGLSHNCRKTVTRGDGTILQPRTTGEGFEFADCRVSPPFPLMDACGARAAVVEARRRLTEAGFDGTEFPAGKLAGWETPHYCATDEMYTEVFEKEFGLIFEDAWWDRSLPGVNRAGDSLVMLPYALRHNGAIYLQTFLGFVSDCARDPDLIVEQSAALSNLRHGVEAAFFFHADILTHRILENIVPELVKQGWEFPDLSVAAAEWGKSAETSGR